MDFWAHAAAQARHPTHKIFALKSCLRKWINHSSRINTVLLKHRQKHVAEHMQLWGYLEQAQLLANTQCCQRHKLSRTCQPIENCFPGIIRFQEVTRRIENPEKSTHSFTIGLNAMKNCIRTPFITVITSKDLYHQPINKFGYESRISTLAPMTWRVNAARFVPQELQRYFPSKIGSLFFVQLSVALQAIIEWLKAGL